jgi:hypothetical protein
MRIFLLTDERAGENFTRVIVVRALAEDHARQIASDCDRSEQWMGSDKTACRELSVAGDPEVLWI